MLMGLPDDIDSYLIQVVHLSYWFLHAWVPFLRKNINLLGDIVLIRRTTND